MSTKQLLDLLERTSQPVWRTRTMEKVNATEEMSIVPSDENRPEPLLKIQTKDEHGNVLSELVMNQSAVDDQINKLIKMRDILEDMKQRKETGT